jgi:small subunit ribosomal protein S5
MAHIDASKLDLKEKVVHINRVAKVVKGGRRFSFSVLVVIGDGHGHVGIGAGKASEVPDGIRNTLYHEVIGEFKASRVLLRPASAGTGIIAGGGVRAVCELAGIHDVLTKSICSDNIFNVVQATLKGLREIRSPETIAALRGKPVENLSGVVKS